MAVRPQEPDKSNIQGVVFSAYGKFHATHMIMRRNSIASNVNAFVKALLPYVQSGARWGAVRPQKFVNLGFTFEGLLATNVPEINWDMFPVEYRIGPTSYYAQQNLYDLGQSAPENWTFGNDQEDKRVDVVVHCYGNGQPEHKDMIGIIGAAANAHGLTEVLPMKNPPGRFVKSHMPLGIIHFGYLDGMDQPDLDWPDPWPSKDPDQGYTGPAALNNFVIGYPDSLILPGPTRFQIPDDPTAAFAKDGCYNAFRVLDQDVKAFEDFLYANAPAVSARLGKDVDYAREWIAAKMNGRWRNGSPMEVSPHEPDPKTATKTDFDYSTDTKGTRCPFSSHTRITNPRDQELVMPAKPLPRILRRGMSFGEPGMKPNYEGERGLVGLFLCGSIGEQFEKMSNWINANSFSPLFTQNAQDPLVANGEVPLAKRTFTIPMDDGEPVVLDLTDYQFVSTRGTAYCFLPSLKALQTIANTNA